MGTTQTFRYQDYELACSAKPTDGGKFQPALVITKLIWPTRARTIAVQRGDFATAEEAIASAHAQGIEWVALYG